MKMYFFVRKWLLCLSLLCGIFSLGAQSNSPTYREAIVRDSIAPELEISFSLFVNQKPRGEINAGIWHNSAIIEKDIASKILMEYLRPDIYTIMFDTVFRDLKWLTADDFALAGIKFQFDSAQLIITIEVPPEYSPITDLDFVPEQVPNFKPILRPAPFSGFIQNDSSVQVFNIEKVSAVVSSTFNSIIDLRGFHIFSNGYISYLSESSPAFAYALNHAYLAWNSNAHSTQVSLGMLPISGISYQTQPLLLAASIASAENIPYVIKQGFIDDKTEFTIKKTARVTVEVNGKIIRQAILAPGNYRILDLPFTTGLNEYVLRIEESDGNTQVLRRLIPREASILQMGTSRYAFSAGMSTEDWNEFLATGYYLYGFSPRFSGGINLQGDKRSILGGITFTTALPFGTINAALAAVGRWDGWGNTFAPEATISYNFSYLPRESIPSFSLATTYRGAGFSAPNIEAPSSDPPSAFIAATAGLYSKVASRTGLNLSYSIMVNETTPSTTTHDIFMSMSQGLSDRGNITLSGRLSIPSSGSPTVSATLAFSIMPKDTYQRMFNYFQTSQGDTNISILDKIALFGKLFDTNISASNILPGSSNNNSLSINVRNTSEFYELSANAALNHSGLTGSYSEIGLVQFRSTMAFVGSQIGFTRQIPDSFLLISSSEELKNQPVSYSLSTGSQYMTRAGQNVVLPLNSYRTAVLSTNLLEAPVNVNPRYPFVVISSGYRSGILFQSGVIRRFLIVGRLLDQNGTPIGYLPGNVLDQGGALVTSTFTDETGMFQIYDVLPGIYTIEWPLDYGSTQFELKESAVDSVDLGDIGVHSLKN